MINDIYDMFFMRKSVTRGYPQFQRIIMFSTVKPHIFYSKYQT